MIAIGKESIVLGDVQCWLQHSLPQFMAATSDFRECMAQVCLIGDVFTDRDSVLADVRGRLDMLIAFITHLENATHAIPLGLSPTALLQDAGVQRRIHARKMLLHLNIAFIEKTAASVAVGIAGLCRTLSESAPSADTIDTTDTKILTTNMVRQSHFEYYSQTGGLDSTIYRNSGGHGGLASTYNGMYGARTSRYASHIKRLNQVVSEIEHLQFVLERRFADPPDESTAGWSDLPFVPDDA